MLTTKLACSAEPTQVPKATHETTTEDSVGDELKSPVVSHYAEGIHALYSRRLALATDMDAAIDIVVADPTPATLESAKRAWLLTRDDYSRTEAFRFYGGPIGNDEGGPEGLINAWASDEAHIDHVAGNPGAGNCSTSARWTGHGLNAPHSLSSSSVKPSQEIKQGNRYDKFS